MGPCNGSSDWLTEQCGRVTPPQEQHAGERASICALWGVWLAQGDLVEPRAISFDRLIETSLGSPRSCHQGSVSKWEGVEVTLSFWGAKFPPSPLSPPTHTHTHACWKPPTFLAPLGLGGGVESGGGIGCAERKEGVGTTVQALTGRNEVSPRGKTN